jgi:hypothetical protein
LGAHATPVAAATAKETAAAVLLHPRCRDRSRRVSMNRSFVVRRARAAGTSKRSENAVVARKQSDAKNGASIRFVAAA